MFDYFLPNEVRIDADALCEAILEEGEYPRTYLDVKTGALVQIASKESFAVWSKEIGKSGRYAACERISAEDREEITEEFFDTVLPPRHVARARKALQKSGWKGLETFLEKETDDYGRDWDDFALSAAEERLHEWLMNLPGADIAAKASVGCGHCAFCELAKKGETDPEKLAHAVAVEETMHDFEEQMLRQKNGLA